MKQIVSNTVKQPKPLFLSDIDFADPLEEARLPVIDGWSWTARGTGEGYLEGPDGSRHCAFDLVNGTLAFEPGGDAVTAPGLSASLVQEMGERYAAELAFNEMEKAEYETMAKGRAAAKTARDRQVRETLVGTVQLERTHGTWTAHADAGRIRELTGMDVLETMSRDEGIRLFNQMTERLHGTPVRDPTGYMALSGNVYDAIRTEYRNQYEDMLQAIDNGVIDGTGYAIDAVLAKLQSTVRKNVTQYCLPDGENYGDLRFVPATPERKAAIQDFVKCRVSKTLIYEKKRDYERSAIERADRKYEQAGARLKETLADMGPERATEADETDLLSL